MQHGGCDGKFPLHATREGACEFICSLQKSGILEEELDTGARLVALNTVQIGEKSKVLVGCQFLINRNVLRNYAESTFYAL